MDSKTFFDNFGHLAETPNIERIPFCPPSPKTQHRIVAKVDHLMSLCDALEAKLKQSQADGDRLLAAAVHQLLNGAKPGLLADHQRGPVPSRV